ncbi:MAG: hypothetical protein KBH99_11390 [Syntrophobacteraceae bacterium]|nr:hypothetical protein [Syntrophobacteraceae bacterium]
MAPISPKTLAKTLTYLAYTAPGEFGLFWNPDGTMPWKELYWALQEDEGLRFVRESHLKELRLLGIDMPFVLEKSILRLKDEILPPRYPLETNLLPRKLYAACRPKQIPAIRQKGLPTSSRPFLPLPMDRELALRMGRRRYPDSLVLEIVTDEAVGENTLFHRADHGLYLARAIPPCLIHFPLLRREDFSKPNSKKRTPAGKTSSAPSTTPGSYFLTAVDLGMVDSHQAVETKKPRTGKGKRDWKRDARSERRKRTV